jgi:predicted phosphoribosyltransferase
MPLFELVWSQMVARFQDRYEAGRELARLLGVYAGRQDVLVLALPRGGVPVGFEVARALRAPLDVFIVRKLGVPGHEELAMGAIASGDVVVLNDEVINDLQIPPRVIELVAAAEKEELDQRERLYRDNRLPPDPGGRIVILVDDGLATGSTMRAAIEALRSQAPARTVVAVPLAAPQTCAAFRLEVDEIVCARTPDPFYAVGLWYDDFSPTTDQEIHRLLRRSRQEEAGASQTEQAGSTG